MEEEDHPLTPWVRHYTAPDQKIDRRYVLKNTTLCFVDVAGEEW